MGCWSSDDMALLKDVGWLALPIVAFTVAVALVVPVVLLLLRQLVALIPYKALLQCSDDLKDSQTLQRMAQNNDISRNFTRFTWVDFVALRYHLSGIDAAALVSRLYSVLNLPEGGKPPTACLACAL